MVLYTKSMTISFKIFLMFILTIPDSLTTKLILYKESTQILEKIISYRGAALWKEIEQKLKTLLCSMSPSANIIRTVF